MGDSSKFIKPSKVTTLTDDYNALVDLIIKNRTDRGWENDPNLTHITAGSFIKLEDIDRLKTSLSYKDQKVKYKKEFPAFKPKEKINLIRANFLNEVKLAANDISYIACNSGCTISCMGNCGGDCIKTCTEVCRSDCSGSCRATESASCTGCSRGCTGACSSNCSNTCGKGCGLGCGQGCATSCAGACDSGCQSGCKSGCQNQGNK